MPTCPPPTTAWSSTSDTASTGSPPPGSTSSSAAWGASGRARCSEGGPPVCSECGRAPRSSANSRPAIPYRVHRSSVTLLSVTANVGDNAAAQPIWRADGPLTVWPRVPTERDHLRAALKQPASLVKRSYSAGSASLCRPCSRRVGPGCRLGAQSLIGLLPGRCCAGEDGSALLAVVGQAVVRMLQISRSAQSAGLMAAARR
jgi:hypothetical protein